MQIWALIWCFATNSHPSGTLRCVLLWKNLLECFIYVCARNGIHQTGSPSPDSLTRLCHGCGALWPERTIFFMSPVKEPIYNCEIQSIKSNAPSAAFPPSAEHITKCHNALRIPGDTPTQSTRMSRKINTWSSGGQNKPLD